MGRGRGGRMMEATRELRAHISWEKKAGDRKCERETGKKEERKRNKKWHEKWPFFASSSHLSLPWQWTIKLDPMSYCMGTQLHRLLILSSFFISVWLSKISNHLRKKVSWSSPLILYIQGMRIRQAWSDICHGAVLYLILMQFDYIFRVELINRAFSVISPQPCAGRLHIKIPLNYTVRFTKNKK